MDSARESRGREEPCAEAILGRVLLGLGDLDLGRVSSHFDHHLDGIHRVSRWENSRDLLRLCELHLAVASSLTRRRG